MHGGTISGWGDRGLLWKRREKNFSSLSHFCVEQIGLLTALFQPLIHHLTECLTIPWLDKICIWISWCDIFLGLVVWRTIWLNNNKVVVEGPLRGWICKGGKNGLSFDPRDNINGEICHWYGGRHGSAFTNVLGILWWLWTAAFCVLGPKVCRRFLSRFELRRKVKMRCKQPQKRAFSRGSSKIQSVNTTDKINKYSKWEKVGLYASCEDEEEAAKRERASLESSQSSWKFDEQRKPRGDWRNRKCSLIFQRGVVRSGNRFIW